MTEPSSSDDAGARELGDMSPEEFERQGRRVVEWIAEYFRTGDGLAVLPPVEPGEIRNALAPTPPRSPGAFRRRLA